MEVQTTYVRQSFGSARGTLWNGSSEFSKGLEQKNLSTRVLQPTNSEQTIYIQQLTKRIEMLIQEVHNLSKVCNDTFCDLSIAQLKYEQLKVNYRQVWALLPENLRQKVTVNRHTQSVINHQNDPFIGKPLAISRIVATIEKQVYDIQNDCSQVEIQIRTPRTTMNPSIVIPDFKLNQCEECENLKQANKTQTISIQNLRKELYEMQKENYKARNQQKDDTSTNLSQFNSSRGLNIPQFESIEQLMPDKTIGNQQLSAIQEVHKEQSTLNTRRDEIIIPVPENIASNQDLPCQSPTNANSDRLKLISRASIKSNRPSTSIKTKQLDSTQKQNGTIKLRARQIK